MPSTSGNQRKLMAIALQIKRGKTPASYSEEAAKLADTMTEVQLEDFAQKSAVERLDEFVRNQIPPRPGLRWNPATRRWIKI